MLTPLRSIPQRELLFCENEQVRASLRRGVHDAAEGSVSRRDDFIDRNASDDDVWESYVENHTPGAWRIWWYYGPPVDAITVLTIGPHPD